MELYLPPERIDRNPKNGRFLKGITPHNKGKKLKDYLSQDKIDYIKSKLSRNGNPNIGGWNKKQVIGIKDGEIFGVYESSYSAGEILKISDRNIRMCCLGKRKRCGGIQWYHESDYDKWSKQLKQ